MHVIIIGAGIIGLAAAHRLLDQGCAVTLVDRGEQTAASRGNAGIIAHVDIQPLASPQMLLQAARWFIDPLGPLAVRPAYVAKLAPWLFRFVLASTPSRMQRSTQGLVPLPMIALPACERVRGGPVRMRARPAGERMLGRLDLKRELNRNGMLCVCENADASEAGKARYREQVDAGIPIELSDGSVLRTMEPALAERFQRAAFFP